MSIEVELGTLLQIQIPLIVGGPSCLLTTAESPSLFSLGGCLLLRLRDAEEGGGWLLVFEETTTSSHLSEASSTMDFHPISLSLTVCLWRLRGTAAATETRLFLSRDINLSIR